MAQDLGALAGDRASPDGQMLLEADTLTYNNDTNTVTAAGSVRIDYGGNRLVANQVTYDRNTSRLIASGGVELIDPDGTRVTSDKVDITDDFGEGFVNALRVETADKTYFAAESALRRGSRVTIFNNGVYTACAPCEEEPDSAPIWRVKARRIIWDGQAKVVRFERSRFELFGMPIAYVPAFEIADPTVKRKSGFLMPSVTFNDEKGVGVSVPYYFALSPTYDLTLTGTGYTKQGFLGQAEWRQRFNNGAYTLQLAGISQREPTAFDPFTVDSGTEDDPNELRGMVGTKGVFQINPRWTFGWDVLAQTDKNFASRYGIEGFNNSVQRDQVYLVGLEDRSYFDLRAMHFQVQEETLDVNPLTGLRNGGARDPEQPYVLPTFDYARIADEPVLGGELRLDLNSRVISRDSIDAFGDDNDPRVDDSPFIRGLDDQNSRITAEAEWKRTYTTENGLQITPLLAFQADANAVETSDESIERLNLFAESLNGSSLYQGQSVEEDVLSSFYRYMATLGLELRWPVLFSSTSATHILEPMAQLYARPDEQYGRTLKPNEDAQSLVFDASTLFERDKFSGYDRIEGGSRANVGLRYSGMFGGGWGANGLFGQSFALAGENPYESPDLVNVGAYSGLESERSDFVGLVGITSPFGVSASLSGRFDEETFEMRRGEAKVGYTAGALSVTAGYTFIQEQPLYGFNEDRQEVRSTASLRFMENWTVSGSGSFDLEKNVLVSNSIGFGYDDECFSIGFNFGQTRNRDTQEEEQSIGFNLSFRTLGDFGSAQTVGQN
ncbi:MAG: LPS-assembly protein LptD [Mesorhizobium amorphae]|nr:MAG: LPS-assembly protein LptD [Mesorhizobium amorphae]